MSREVADSCPQTGSLWLDSSVEDSKRGSMEPQKKTA